MKKETEKYALLLSATSGMHAQEQETPRVTNAIFVYFSDKYKRVMYEDILWLSASGSYCFIHQSDGSKVMIGYSLNDVFNVLLDKKLFLRIHRSYVINVFKVTAFVGNTVYIGKESFPVSTPCKEKLLACFDKVYSKRALGKKKDKF